MQYLACVNIQWREDLDGPDLYFIYQGAMICMRESQGGNPIGKALVYNNNIKWHQVV